MAFHIRDTETDRLAREAAARKGVGITQAVKEALESEVSRRSRDYSRLKAEVEAMQTPCLDSQSDKELLDDAWGEPY